MDDTLKGRIEKVTAILKAAGAREVYAFGSAVRGRLREDSDVDLAVSGLPPDRFFRAMGEATGVLGRSLDLVDLDEDTPFTRYLRDEEELERVA
jgi:uncharacterized protein